MSTRHASHAGSWYSADQVELKEQISNWLGQVKFEVTLNPVPGARVIIAPHAGYAYSGQAAAWAYKALDFTKSKRIFILGPSHHKYLTGCALSNHSSYATPLGDLQLDRTTIDQLSKVAQFDRMSSHTDEAEHSLEMHLPFLRYFVSDIPAEHRPLLVPVLVGNTSPDTERGFGAVFAPYLAEPENVFIISSDFCHWGSRFSYTYYLATSDARVESGRSLSCGESPASPVISESITRLDESSMHSIESGIHQEFLNNLKKTKNTVCGRHPIGVIMAAIEILRKEGDIGEHRGYFKFIKYEKSSDVVKASDSSILSDESTSEMDILEEHLRIPRGHDFWDFTCRLLVRPVGGWS